MNYQEKLAFTKANLGEDVQLADDETSVAWNSSKLLGLSNKGLFISSPGTEWKFCQLIPKPKFIDWTQETAESVQLRRKSNGAKVWMNYGLGCAWYHDGVDNCHIPYSKLRKEWETVDGRPCGTEVKDV